MALVVADRVRETTTTTGQGTVTLAGAVTGFQSFSVIGNGNTTYYTIAGQGTNEWEVGVGTYTASGTTLSRDTVLASSAGAPTKTTFSAGTKDVFVTYPAGRAVYEDAALVVDLPANLNFSGNAVRITGDFSNATVANRVMFQTSTVNGGTNIEAIPNGTSTTSVFSVYGNSDPTNTSVGRFSNVGTEVRIASNITGTGTFLPMTFYTGGSERARIDTSGNFQFNSGYGSVATVYGCRVWACINGSSAPASLRAGGNVSSIGDGGTGVYTVNFSVAMPDTNYAANATSMGGLTNALFAKLGLSNAVGSCVVYAGFSDSSTFVKADLNPVSVSVFR